MEKKLFVPGRTELAGNHTDHQQGRILASAVDLGLYADFEKNGENAIHIHSEGYSDFTVRLNHTAVRTGEFGTPKSLVRGMIAAFRELGLDCGGFNAEIRTTLPAGSGLSSSAAYTVLIGKILSELFNDGKVDPVVIARAAQQSENQYFGKPCGLMDQMACAVGGFVAIDFNDPKNPVIEPIAFSLTSAGLSLCIVNTGGNHADLNEDYASVPAEMKKVAAYFGRDVLRGITESEIIANIPVLRRAVGDRAILRALHFVRENERVKEQAEALRTGNIDLFLRDVIASGNSSFRFLQNVYTVKNVEEQGLSLALAVAEGLLENKGCAYRVHGGGFAGTVQIFVRHELEKELVSVMDAVFGKGASMILAVRGDGAIRITL